MKSKQLTLIISLASCGLPTVFAQERTSDTLATVTVTDQSNDVSTISTIELDNPSVSDMATALDNQVAVYFDFDSNGNAKYPVIRGMGENYNEITIDGDKTPNYFTYGHGMYNSGQRSFIETDTLKKIEVEKGRHSPKQGSGALSGSINMRTYDPSDFVSKDDPYYFSVKSGYSTRNDNFGNTLTGAVSVGDASAMVIYTHRESNEIDNFGNDEEKTKHSIIDNKQDNLLLKGEYNLGVGRIVFTGEHFDADKKTTSRYLEKPKTNEPTTRDRFSMKGEFNNIIGLDVLEAKISYQDLDNTSQFWSNQSKQLKLGEFKQERLAVSVDGEKTFNIGSIDNTLEFGTGFDRSEFDFTRVDTKSQKIYRPLPLTTRDTTHAYIINSIAFENGITISPGVRVEHKKLSPENDLYYQNNKASAVRAITGSSNTVVTPSINTSWEINDKLNVYASYAEGEKTADDINFTSVDHGGMFYILPNPKLEDEQSKNIEFGFNYAINDKASFGVNVFQTKYDNFIDYKNAALPNGKGIMFPANIGSAKTNGVEISSNVALSDSWDANLAVAWMRGTVKSDDGSSSAMLSSHPNNAVIGLNYHNSDIWGAGLNLKLSGKGEKAKDPVLFQTPGYGSTNLTAWWKPLKSLKVSGGVYNVFDKQYWGNDINGTYTKGRSGPVNMDRYTQPGRTFGINLKYEY